MWPRPHPPTDTSYASEIKPFPVAMVDLQQMRTTIDATGRVYPVLNSVDVRRFAAPSGSRRLPLVGAGCLIVTEVDAYGSPRFRAFQSRLAYFLGSPASRQVSQKCLGPRGFREGL